MEEDFRYKQRQPRYGEDSSNTYKITEQYDEEEYQQSQNEEIDNQIDRRDQQYDSLKRNRQQGLTQYSIQHINQSYQKYVLNQHSEQKQSQEDEDMINQSKHNLTLRNNTSFSATNASVNQNQRYQSMCNQDYISSGGTRYSPFKYQIDVDEFKSKKRSLERETMRMEEEVKFLKSNLLSELYKQKQYENSRLYNLIYIIYVASERNKKIMLKESFNKLIDLHYGQMVKADKFYEEKQIQKLFIMWNNWKNYMLDIKVNTLRQLVKQKMINTEKIYERQSIQYHNKKLKAKSFAGWFYYFQKNKELLARKRQRVNIHEIFSNFNSKDCSPVRQYSKNRENNVLNDSISQERENSNEKYSFSNKKLNQSRSCKVCKVLDKKNKGNNSSGNSQQCSNHSGIANSNNCCNQNINHISSSNLKQKLLESLNQAPILENIPQIQPGSTKIISVKSFKNPSVSPATRSEFNSRKTSLKQPNIQDSQFFQQNEKIVDYSQLSPQRKLQEVIAKAKSKIQQFQNSTLANPYLYNTQQGKGYLTNMSDDEDNINNRSNNNLHNNNNSSNQLIHHLPSQQNQQIKQSIPQTNDKFNNNSTSTSAKKLKKSSVDFNNRSKINNENAYPSTIKKQKNHKNTDFSETYSAEKNQGIDFQSTKNSYINNSIQQNQLNLLIQDSDGYNPTPLKDSSLNYKNQFSFQKNIGQQIQFQQDQYTQQSLCANQSPKFNTMYENKVNFEVNQQECEDDDEGYNIQNYFAKNSSKNKIQNNSQQKTTQSNVKNEKNSTKQQQQPENKPQTQFKTFKQRSNSISQYTKNSSANTNNSLYSQITQRRNSLHSSKTNKKDKIPSSIQTDGFQFISPSYQQPDLLSTKSFYQETRSSSMKKKNDSLTKFSTNNFNQSKKNSFYESGSMVFSFYHPTNSKNIRNLQKSPFESRYIDDEQFIEEQQNEYNPISFESSLRQEHNLNLSCINGSSVNPNKSGFLDCSLQNKILTPKEHDKNLRQIEKRALERKKRLDELKKKQFEWKKVKEDQQKQIEEEQLKKEREQYQKEYREYQAIKRVQKKSKKTQEEQKQLQKQNEEKAEQYYSKKVYRMVFKILNENHECNGKLEIALDFQYLYFQRRYFKAFVNQTINEKDRQKQKEQAQLEKSFNHYSLQLKKKCMDKIKIFTYESLVEKENYAKQREEILMRTAFQSMFQQLPIKKKTEIDVDKVIKQFRKVVLLERGFRGWKNQYS